MTDKKSNIIEILQQKPAYKNALFRRGYLITDQIINDLSTYPFYNNWKKFTAGKTHDGTDVNVFVHTDQQYYSLSRSNIVISIIGHACNPFTMQYKEETILQECVDAYKVNEATFFEKVSELTGIHLILLNDNGRILFVQDCGGMKACYYGTANQRMVLTSHPQLLDDLFEVTPNPYVAKLIKKWFFSIGGRYLPGDTSQFENIRRLGPNTVLTYKSDFTVKRFFPTEAHPEIAEKDYESTITRLQTLIHSSIDLCSEKWTKAAISLSGGMDSKTTMACANGIYDKFKYYSFHCKPQEQVDAEAAHSICKNLGVAHTIYPIPENPIELDGYEELKHIILHNSGYIGKPHEHEIRKFVYLYHLNDFDAELKSWISEIGRAMWQKKYGVKLPDTLSPRHFSIFQTRYLGAPALLRYSDREYKNYLTKIDLIQPPFNYEHSDMFYWEFRFGSWGTNVNTIHDVFNHTITMPLNNRKIIDMFLWFPHEFRKADMVNKEIIKNANPLLLNLNINVHNVYLGGKRVMLEKIYYYYRLMKPFSIINF